MSQSDNRLHLRCWVRTLRVTSYRRGHSICPRRLVSHFAIGGALLSLPCVRGGAALRAAEGLYLTKTIFLFLFCKLHIFTIPQELARRLPLPGGSFLGVRTLQRTFCLFRRARACSRRSLYLIRRYFSELLNNLESSKKRLHAWRDCGTIKAEKRRLFAAVTAETEKENRNGDF